MRLGTKRIGDGSAGAVQRFDRVQHSHVIRITGSLKPVMLNDRNLIGRELLLGIDRAESLVEQFKVGRKALFSSAPQRLLTAFYILCVPCLPYFKPSFVVIACTTNRAISRWPASFG